MGCQCEGPGLCPVYGLRVDEAFVRSCPHNPPQDAPRIPQEAADSEAPLPACRNRAEVLGLISGPLGGLPVYRCHHWAIGETSGAECLECPYVDSASRSAPPSYDAVIPRRLASGGLGRCRVGIVTAPRKGPTISKTVESLHRSGFDRLTVFAEPGVDPVDGVEWVGRRQTLGAFGNWWLGLSELFQSDPTADSYAMLQDDVEAAGVDIRGESMRAYLDRALWPEGCDVVSLFCSEEYSQALPGWYPQRLPWVYGALGFVWRASAALDFLKWSAGWAVESKKYGFSYPNNHNTDVCVGRWAVETRRHVWFPFPSLLQHTGDHSTIWPPGHGDNVGRRRAGQFAGDRLKGS